MLRYSGGLHRCWHGLAVPLMTLDQYATHGLDVHQEGIELAIALVNPAAGHLVCRAPQALASPSAA
jgi:hypothetical protein